MLLKIAIPIVEGRLSGHFGGTKFFAVLEADRKTRAVVRMQTIAAPPHEPGSIPRWLRGQGVQILIVGENGIGRRALDYLLHHAIEVLAGRSGAAVESLIAASLEGRLTRMQGVATISANQPPRVTIAGWPIILKGKRAAMFQKVVPESRISHGLANPSAMATALRMAIDLLTVS